MSTKFTKLLPPDYKDFEKIAKIDLSEEGQELRETLQNEGYEDLLKVLNLYREKLINRNWWWTFRRLAQEAYRHYLANMDGKIPELAIYEENDFRVESWVKAYAEDLGIKVKKVEQSVSEKGEVQDGYLDVAFGERVNRIETENLIEGESSAFAFRRLSRTINKLRYGKALTTPGYIFRFDAKTPGYSHQNAAILAEFSLLSYFHLDFLKLQLKQWNYNRLKWIENLETDTQCLITEKEDHTILCFRGTSSFKDTLIDLKIKKVSEGDSKVRIHSGFTKALDTVWAELLKLLEKRESQTPVFICGHSLGGALAKLTAYRLHKTSFQVGGVYTYGAPRLGNKHFANVYEEMLGHLTYLIVNYKDIVPQIPPKIFGFRHVGAKVKHFGHDHHLVDEVQTRGLGSRSLGEPSEERALTPYELGQMRRQLAQALETDALMRDYFHGKEIDQKSQAVSRGVIDDHSLFEYIFKLGINALEGEIENTPSIF